MVYELDEEGLRQAVLELTAEQMSQLRDQCRRKAAEFGCEGVRAHEFEFSVTAWAEVTELPDGLRNGVISRGDVLDIGRHVREMTASPKDLLVASFVWGWARAGYGPRRLRNIVDDAGERLEPALNHVREVIFADPGSPDPVAGYAQLYGGFNYKKRAAPGEEPWDRLRWYGPAFFTKFLYFLTPGALILDNRLARAVCKLSGMPNLVTADGRSLTWTPYRYAIYLR